MTEFEYMILYPIISSLLATILVVLACIFARHMYWKDREKKRIIRMGKALDRYLSQNRDCYLDEDNIPEWFEKYKQMKVKGETKKDSAIIGIDLARGKDKVGYFDE